MGPGLGAQGVRVQHPVWGTGHWGCREWQHHSISSKVGPGHRLGPLGLILALVGSVPLPHPLPAACCWNRTITRDPVSHGKVTVGVRQVNTIAASYRNIFRGWFCLESRRVAAIYKGTEEEAAAIRNLQY